MYEFVCPHCSIPLRVRDESYRNRTIPCPECGKPVLIQDSPQGLVCLPGEAGGPVGNAHPSTPSVARKLPIRPLALAAGGLAASLVLTVFLLSGGRNPAGPEDSIQTASPDRPDRPSPPVSVEAREVTDPIPPKQEPQDPLERQYREIFRLMEASKTSKAGPVAKSPSPGGGLSWIAGLAASQFPDSHPQWNQDWNAAANDEFVRRRFPAFDNPQIQQKAGEDNYPATHFVGVSGVGTDAIDLPRTHPRAGVFSRQGPARPVDITDGLSNSMLVAGVDSQLGSWASPGRSTVRSFAREPYVHGPDGFGTGEAEQMQVLMADGSVRTLNAKTDPVIIRRMAAIADGISLSPQVPGDPLTLPVNSATHPPMGGEAPADPKDLPIMVELAPDLPVLDLKPRLAQKIAAFETARPIPLRQILGDLQELLGVRLETGTLPADVLDRPVTISLQDTTAEEILKKLSASAGISCQILENKIQLTVKP